MSRIKESFEEIERKMIGNIANSLFQIYFHENATPEELKEYYGWERDFDESERDELVADSVKRIIQEQEILKFYVENKDKIIKKYEKKDPTGDLDLPLQRATGDNNE